MYPKLQQIVTGSLFAGMEIQFLSAGIKLHLVVLRKKGKQVVLEKAVNDITGIEKLSEHLSKDIPLAVAFTGKGVLHRRIAADPASDLKTLLAKALPNASLKEFYLQTVAAVQDEQFVSLLRKPAADAILEQLMQKQFSVVGCSLGPLSVIHLLSLLEENKNELRFGNHLIHLQDHLPEEIQFEEEFAEQKQFNIGGQFIEAEMMVAFAVAFQQLLPEEQRAAAHVESLALSKEDFLQRKLFKTAGKILVVVTFVLLLGNYFACSHYWEMKNELESKVQTDGGAFTDLRNLEKQVHAKKEFLERAGLLNSTNHSYYADQLAAELPPEIRLTRMALSPRLKLSEEDSIGFKPHRIEIDGSCSQSVVLNSWLLHLKTKKWVRSATLESYIQDKTMTQGQFKVAFELE
jgi:Tfp pilus assembly protein PilN